MLKFNRGLISEIKKRLPKNVNPPITLELLLKQKSVEKIEHKNSTIDSDIMISKKAVENFLKNNSSKPFSYARQKENFKQSIIIEKRKLFHYNDLYKKFNTPFQIQHIKMNYQKKYLENKINKKFPHIEINSNKKYPLVLLRRNESCKLLSSDYLTSFNSNNSINNKYNYNENKNRTPKKYRTIHYDNNHKDNIKLTTDYILKNKTSRNEKFIRPNIYFNKIHLEKLNRNLINKSSN